MDVNPSPDVPPVAPEARIAIVGLGAFGRFCLDAYRISPDLQVVAAADPSPEALAQVRRRGLSRSTDWRDVVGRPEVEVIHLAVPPWLRSELVTTALSVGKSVFCEKPLALSLTEADAMIEAASHSRATLGVDYVLRHHPAFHLLYALARSRLLGALRSFSFQNYAQLVPPGHWLWDRARSGGILVEHGVHFFDAYGQIAGPPARVRGSAPRPEASEVTVQYTEGAIGRFYHEFGFPREVERAVGLSVFERGYFEIEGWIPERLQGAVLAPPTQVSDTARQIGLAITAEEDLATRFELRFPDRSGAYIAAIVAGMRDVVRSHRDPGPRMQVSALDARRSLALAIEAQQSIDCGKERSLSR